MFQVPKILSNPNLSIDVRRDVLDAIDIIFKSGFTNPPEELLVKITEFSAKTSHKTTLLCLGRTLMTCTMDEGIRLKNWEIFIRTWLITAFSLNSYSKSTLNGRIGVVCNILSTLFHECENSSTNMTNKSYEVSNFDSRYNHCFYFKSY